MTCASSSSSGCRLQSVLAGLHSSVDCLKTCGFSLQIGGGYHKLSLPSDISQTHSGCYGVAERRRRMGGAGLEPIGLGFFT